MSAFTLYQQLRTQGGFDHEYAADRARQAYAPDGYDQVVEDEIVAALLDRLPAPPGTPGGWGYIGGALG